MPILVLVDVQDQNYLLFNHLLLTCKCNIYNSRVNNNINLQSLKCVTSGVKYIEKAINNDDTHKKRKISNIWKLIDSFFKPKMNA